MKHNSNSKSRQMLRLVPALVTAMLLCLLFTTAGCGSDTLLLSEASFTPAVISPNADGIDDVTRIEFMLHQNADVSIVLQGEDGREYVFRHPQRLAVKETPYTVLFSGVVPVTSDENEKAENYRVIQRLLPNGKYTWDIRAINESGFQQNVTGTMVVQSGDTLLPGIQGLSIYPQSFTPNQDGIGDRVTINFTLDKQLADLQVYLVGNDNVRHAIPEDFNTVEALAEGWHTFDYDGGIDAGASPPADGLYTVFVEAEDVVGQRTMTSSTLEIIDAGIPRAYVVNNTVDYSSNTMVLSETLCFTATVENDSDTHIRTTGPWPGTTYRSDENRNTLGWHDESGVFRVGMDFDTSLSNYPFRWGIGQPGVNLVQIDDYWYLPPHARSIVTGCVQIVDVPVRNPLYYWLGLIHEDVEIVETNNHIDPVFVTIWEP